MIIIKFKFQIAHFGNLYGIFKSFLTIGEEFPQFILTLEVEFLGLEFHAVSVFHGLAHLDAHQIDLIVLAGFLSILSAKFTGRYADRIVNVHPSLIPSFCGKGFYGLKVHEAALAYGVKVTGATVHYVNEIPDGGQILLQKAVEILPDDTPEVLQRRVMEQAEWILLPQAAEMVSHKLMQQGV